MGVLDKLTGATAATRTYSVYLDPAARAEHDKIVGSLDELATLDERDGSLADPFPHTNAAVDRLEELRLRMANSKVTFTLQRVEWTRRMALAAEHSPREGNAVDAVRGYNIETFLPALVRASTTQIEDASGDVATAEEITDDHWASLFAALNFESVNQLSTMALEVNDGEANLPRSAHFLRRSPASEVSSEPPKTGTSVRDGSTAGNRRTARKSATTKKAASASS